MAENLDTRSIAWKRRHFAKALTSAFLERNPRLRHLAPFEVETVLEQAVFAALHFGPLQGMHGIPARHEASTPRRWPLRLRSILETGRGRTPKRGAIVAIARAPIHVEVLQQIAAELGAESAAPLAVVTEGFVPQSAPAWAEFATLQSALAPQDIARLAALETRILATRFVPPLPAMNEAPDELRSPLLGIVRSALMRATFHTVRLEALVREVRPSLLMTFDESGLWSRIIPKLGRRYGVPSLDLPHAELTVPAVLVGADYDTFTVFGSYSRETLIAAGIDEGRIVEVGAPRTDLLIRRVNGSAARDTTAKPRRVVLASQYVVGSMTPTEQRRIASTALAFAVSLQPAELVVVPHPLETDGTMAEVIRTAPAMGAISVRQSTSLYEELAGAYVLVTGWSNSVYEALIAGVPAVTIRLDQDWPGAHFAKEGLSLEIRRTDDVAHVASLLSDPARVSEYLQGARQSVTRHVYATDGLASRRCASVIASMVRG